jgi:hypothetical protein
MLDAEAGAETEQINGEEVESVNGDAESVLGD